MRVFPMVAHDCLISVEGQENRAGISWIWGWGRESQDDPNPHTWLGYSEAQCVSACFSLLSTDSTHKDFPLKWTFSNSEWWNFSIFKINLHVCCLWKIYTPDFLTVHPWDKTSSAEPSWGLFGKSGGCSEVGAAGQGRVSCLKHMLVGTFHTHTHTLVSWESSCLNAAPGTHWESCKFEQLQPGMKGFYMGCYLLLSRGNLKLVSPVWLETGANSWVSSSVMDTNSLASFKESQGRSA